MKRYQVYLNSKSVDIIDDFEKETKIPRSAVIRMAINSLAQNLIKISPSFSERKGDLDEIIGIINTKNKRTTNSSEKIDDIYHNR